MLTATGQHCLPQSRHNLKSDSASVAWRWDSYTLWLAVVPEAPVLAQWPLVANGLNVLRLACPILNGIFFL